MWQNLFWKLWKRVSFPLIILTNILQEFPILFINDRYILNLDFAKKLYYTKFSLIDPYNTFSFEEMSIAEI